jgi:AcrR family transcriptional regulator
MRARKARTEIRQDQIARAAMKLLAVRGWQRVSLAAIARQVGVVPSAVYRHFGGKDEVLDAVLDLVEHHFHANVQKAHGSTCDPVARLHAVLRRHVELIVSGVPVPRIMLSDGVFTGTPRHRQRVQVIYRNYLAAIAGIFRDGQDQGLIQREPGAETLSVMWLGLVQSPAILWLLGKGAFDLPTHCERAWTLFANSIRTRRSAAPCGA